jgi:hypothetical protein
MSDLVGNDISIILVSKCIWFVELIDHGRNISIELIIVAFVVIILQWLKGLIVRFSSQGDSVLYTGSFSRFSQAAAITTQLDRYGIIECERWSHMCRSFS